MKEFITHHWRPMLEVILMAGAMLVAWRYLRKATGARLLAAIAVIVVSLLVTAHLLQMELIRALAFFIGLMLVIVFQPEVRRAFVSLGSHRIFSTARENQQLVELLDETVQQLSAKRIGALFAFERGMDLDQFVETGVEIDSRFTPELVLTIFHPKTALHDGGMVLRQGRIRAAGCVFPVSQRELNDRSIGLRHRAGMGITEQTDAVAVVVSEETGQISLCGGGERIPTATSEAFCERLTQLLSHRPREAEARDKEPLTERAATKRLEA